MMVQRASDLVLGAIDELRRDPGAVAIACVLLIVIGTLSDLGGDEMLLLSILASEVVAFVLQYALTRRAMRAGGLPTKMAPGDVGGFFGLCFLSNLAILLGFILLIVPGVWLYARWLAAVPILFAEGKGVSEALATSAARTRSLLRPIIFAAGFVYVPYLGALGVDAVLFELATVSTGALVIINIGLTVSQIAGWYLAIAIYRATRPEPVEAVFA